MDLLHRHQLVWLTESAWSSMLHREWSMQLRPCIEHWALHQLPLVVTRQRGEVQDGLICVALSGPTLWNRVKLPLRIAQSDVSHFAEFPIASEAQLLLPAQAHSAWKDLCSSLTEAGITARVYGSYGWQLLTGMRHVQTASDVDLWLEVVDSQHADVAGEILKSFPTELLRVDGELMFSNGTAVAWREWTAWRAGHVRDVLVKTLDSSSLLQRFADVEPSSGDYLRERM